MKILFLTWKDIKHPYAGGAEKIMYEYSKGLVRKGHSVTWFASSFLGGSENEIIDGINIIRKFNLNNIYFLCHKWYKNFKKNNDIDLIIDEAGGIPLLSPFFEKNIPIYFFIHHIGDKEWDEKFIYPFNKIAKFVFYKIIKLYKNYKTITVSNSTKQELIQKFGFEDNNIKVIENACDITPIEKIDFDKKKDSILFIGRLMPIKRVEDSIKAFYEFIKNDEKFKNYELNIVGNDQDKKYVNNLKKLVKSLGIQKQVNFLGHINRNEFKNFIQENKLILVTSIKEGFGLVVLEANSYGIPAIGYDVAGLRDSIKDSKNGYLIKDGDYRAMGEKIGELLNDIDLYEKMSIRSLEYVKNYTTWEKNTSEFEKFILELKS